MVFLLSCAFDSGDPAPPTNAPDAPAADAAIDTTVDLIPLGGACDPSADRCDVGTACCTECCKSTETPVCTTVGSDHACPLPNLYVDEDRLSSQASVIDRYFAEDDCAIVEGCVTSPGWRRLLTFSVTTPNDGTADLNFGKPVASDIFVFSPCHGHFHFSGYAEYRLTDDAGVTMGEGHKQAFCLEDFEPWLPDAPQEYNYTCRRQGITRGWADTYGPGLDCQWIDVTDTPYGEYDLTVEVNPERILPELDYTDDITSVRVSVPNPADEPPVTTECPGPREGPYRNCGWTEAGSYPCTPGEQVQVGCEKVRFSTCEGDPMVRVCDGADGACRGLDALGYSDDSYGGLCPSAVVTCPESGTMEALIAGYRSGQPAACVVVAGAVIRTGPGEGGL